ncbi:carbohydrate ABC transporter permease [Oceaniglobus trochenteri]|uniref:carbohydrate ABC transporter permease n=1 Tax=Oceaniglobus trochenteri TaxID=2763260 RepID=UPI001CFFF991|nr:sugar ABC transporter permease [Oceaniglobus trochenteri]
MAPRAFQPSTIAIWLFLLPGIVVYGGVVLTPLIGGFYYSLFETKNFQFHWAGLANYVRLWGDGDFWFTLRNNFIIILLSVIFQVTTAFIIAVLMNSRLVIAPKFLRTAIFFPVILSPVVTSFVWILVFDINSGLLNNTLEAIGLGGLQQKWLDDPKIVIYSVTVALVWQYIGLFLVIFLSGLSAINQETIEAAEVDGASTFQKTIYVIFPQLASTWSVAIVLAISGGLKIFEHIFVMTGGGPGLSSTVVAQYAYSQSFLRANFSYGNTIAIAIVVLSLTLVSLTIWAFNRFVVKDRI